MCVNLRPEARVTMSASADTNDDSATSITRPLFELPATCAHHLSCGFSAVLPSRTPVFLVRRGDGLLAYLRHIRPAAGLPPHRWLCPPALLAGLGHHAVCSAHSFCVAIHAGALRDADGPGDLFPGPADGGPPNRAARRSCFSIHAMPRCTWKRGCLSR